MEEGKVLCDDMIEEENAIDQDPERKEELFWEQYNNEAERNKDTAGYDRPATVKTVHSPGVDSHVTLPP